LRRIPLSRRSHVTGFQPLSTGTAEHESALERDFVTLSSFLDAGVSITSQPVTITFRDGTQSRRYTPDFLVRWSERRAELIEVKYRADLCTNWDRLRPGFVAARAWAHEREATFRIATERSIRGPLLENAKRLLPLRSAPLEPEIADQVLLAVRSIHAPTFGGVLVAVPENRPAVLATLWRLIAQRTLQVDLTAPVTLATQISAP